VIRGSLLFAGEVGVLASAEGAAGVPVSIVIANVPIAVLPTLSVALTRKL
jgi:hypothetical protein